MPRIAPSLIRHARSRSPNLALLLPACRDLASASAELRWIAEHVDRLRSRSGPCSGTFPPSSSPLPRRLRTRHRETEIARLCALRGRAGVPLQYLLGSQPFGPLDILCRRGVLIPRPETEAYVLHLASLIRRGDLGVGGVGGGGRERVGVLDLCSGTGCIALGLYALLKKFCDHLDVRGVDVSPRAAKLATANEAHNSEILGRASPSQTVTFVRADIFAPGVVSDTLAGKEWHVLVSNPPYVDPRMWHAPRNDQLGLSVRRYEPERALVAPDHAPLAPAGSGEPPDVSWDRQDAFYGRLAELTLALRPRVALWEVGDGEQAARVLGLVERMGLPARGWVAEVWRDWPDMDSGDEAPWIEWGGVDGPRKTLVKGSGNIRSILLCKKDGK